MPISTRIRAALPFLLALAGGLYLYVLARDFPPPPGTGRIGADVWPKLVIGLMLLAAVWGAAQALLVGSGPDDEDALARLAAASGGGKSEAADAPPPSGPSPLAVPLAGVASILAYVALLSIVGFTPATFALMLAVMLLGGFRPVRLAVLIAALGALGFFAVFQRLVYVSLPLGVEPFKSFSTALMALIGVR